MNNIEYQYLTSTQGRRHFNFMKRMLTKRKANIIYYTRVITKKKKFLVTLDNVILYNINIVHSQITTIFYYCII